MNWKSFALTVAAGVVAIILAEYVMHKIKPCGCNK